MNKKILYGIILFVFITLAGKNRLFAQVTLSENLAPLKDFVGKTWKGTFTDGNSNQPMYDVSRWERALNGKAIRILHSVNNGQYGGETMILWDNEQRKLIFYYFTTAGFYTQGTIDQPEKSVFISREEVTGNQQGITEVRSTSKMLADGRMHTKSEYLKNGEWISGHDVIYEEDATAQVIFK